MRTDLEIRGYGVYIGDMKTVAFQAIVITLLLPAILLAHYPKDFSRPLEAIAFGSYNHEYDPQDFWPVIGQSQPDLWIWAGDNIYGDDTREAVFVEKYRKVFMDPHYRKFRESVPVIGTWDDHDYGENNSGKWYGHKGMTQRLALDFLEEPVDSPRRLQEGIYTSYLFGPPDKRVKVILIDNRYHADQPGFQSRLLGREQRDWLKKELVPGDARITFVVSGTPVLVEGHKFEKWANFPLSRDWLLRYIRQKQIPGVIFLSGDRHIHEFSLKNDKETAYPLIDFTSSGMTHYYDSFTGEPNRYRVGQVYAGTGYGLITIDWDRADPRINLQIRSMDNTVMRELPVHLSSLQAHPR